MGIIKWQEWIFNLILFFDKNLWVVEIKRKMHGSYKFFGSNNNRIVIVSVPSHNLIIHVSRIVGVHMDGTLLDGMEWKKVL